MSPFVTFYADSITWAEYWSAQKPGSSGTFSDLYRKISCCQSLSDDDGAWAGATDCVCRRTVKYRTVHACGLSSACTAAARDIKNAQAKIVAFTKKPVTQACSKALDDAICSYHFWGCSGNFPEEVYNNVCQDVCSALETSCRRTCSAALYYSSCLTLFSVSLASTSRCPTSPWACTTTAAAGASMAPLLRTALGRLLRSSLCCTLPQPPSCF
jgi:hypothetical protein